MDIPSKLLHLRYGSGNIVEEGIWKIVRARCSGVCCEIVSPVKASSYKVSQTWLSRRELNKHDTSEHVKLGGEESTSLRSDTKNSRQLRKAGGETGGLPQERAQPLVVQCQMINPGSIRISNINGLNRSYLWIYMYIQVHVTRNNNWWKKRSWVWRKSGTEGEM